MERIRIDEIDYLVGYHTQEYRSKAPFLKEPALCEAKNAWLGIGYYFWSELEFAEYWGQDSKRRTGFYDIYIANLDISECINTVFDEDGYFFWRNKIEETIEYFRNLDIEVSIEEVNRFLADKIWPGCNVAGIIYDDRPKNPKKSERIYSMIPNFYYKKRIQIVIFDKKNVGIFEIIRSKRT